MDSLLVKVTTDGGLEGWGESFGFIGVPVTQRAIGAVIAPLCVGQDATRIGLPPARIAEAIGELGAVESRASCRTQRSTNSATDRRSRSTTTEPFSCSLCRVILESMDGFGELAGSPRAAAELTENLPVLELRVRAFAPRARSLA